MKFLTRPFPITRAYINDLRNVIRNHHGKTFEENLSDKEVVHIAEYTLLKSYLEKVFQNGDDLTDTSIEY